MLVLPTTTATKTTTASACRCRRNHPDSPRSFQRQIGPGTSASFPWWFASAPPSWVPRRSEATVISVDQSIGVTKQTLSSDRPDTRLISYEYSSKQLR
jgi:hypothetical protein